MHILLATGIYPPDIGGPATYAEKLAQEFLNLGHTVTVVTYGSVRPNASERERLTVIPVSKVGSVLSRWFRYSRALRKYGSDADVMIAFSSVSTGVPLMFSGLKKPKKILRLGGDFFWERYTDGGGMKSLSDWYRSVCGFWRIVNFTFMAGILRSFDALVYSTEFQKFIHEKEYAGLPKSTVIENARPTCAPNSGASVGRPHQPFRLLFMGRFVGFKNLLALLDAIVNMPNVTLTLVGSGPMEQALRAKTTALNLGSRVRFQAPVSGEEKSRVFAEHDLLILPSVTEISPNTALEAAAEGLPVLLTTETGLSGSGMICLKPLRLASQIASAIRECIEHPVSTSNDVQVRTYAKVAQDWMQFFSSL
ncbi:glycosyltransferase [Candidatus Peribacteria bacterium]|nr:glycosyltransferase [Candidatus Peribacteria bacterium]